MRVTKPVVVVLPESVNSVLERNIPREAFRRETMLNLFGVCVDDKEMDTWVITHAYKVPGQQESFANVNTLKVRYKTQIVTNGLTVCAQSLGLQKAQPVGTWHLHPDSLDPQPSWDDLNTYRESADLADLEYWVAPIACRNRGTKWLLWDRESRRTAVMPSDHIQVVTDEELDSLMEGLERFCSINTACLLMHMEDLPRPSSVDILPRSNDTGRQRLLPLEHPPSLKGSRLPSGLGSVVPRPKEDRSSHWKRAADWLRAHSGIVTVLMAGSIASIISILINSIWQ